MGKRLPHGGLIAFEGIDGAGKTTQAQRLVEGVRAAGVPALLYSKEPTGGPWGLKIRRSAEGERMPMAEELDAFIEDRREHVREVVKPALDSGGVVGLDRYYFLNAAYQGDRGGGCRGDHPAERRIRARARSAGLSRRSRRGRARSRAQARHRDQLVRESGHPG